MEMEFGFSTKNHKESTCTRKSFSFKHVFVLAVAALLVCQAVVAGFSMMGLRSADADTALGSNLIYSSVYGVRVDGISFMTKQSPAGSATSDTVCIVDSAGKVTYTFQPQSSNASSYPMDANYLNGYIPVEKNSVDGSVYTLGLIDPKTGKSIMDFKDYESYAAFFTACKAAGYNTTEPSKTKVDLYSLPNGVKVQISMGSADGSSYTLKYIADGKIYKIGDYTLGNPKYIEDSQFNAVYRTNYDNKTMYYVYNKDGKVGTVDKDGNVVIPFDYDAYFDANVGSDLILLKKGDAWQYFDLASVGYQSKKPESDKPAADKPAADKPTSEKDKWVKDPKGWWYRYADGTYPKGTALEIGGKWYRFNDTGYMITGWYKDKATSTWYYYEASGAMKTGWVKVKGAWYYLDKTSGAMATGAQTIDNVKYAFDKSGAMVTGWAQDADKWYYYDKSGAMKTGWVKDGKSWYYLDKTSGVMQTGPQTIDEVKYYLDEKTGAMMTGWVKNAEGAWYYYDKSGAMKTGWVKDGKSWYLLDKTSGVMLTGIQADGEAKYYLAKSGAMKTGWVEDVDKWYYFNKSGAMVTKKWVGNYYLGDDGIMATDTIIDGKWYVDAKGKWDPKKDPKKDSAASTTTGSTTGTTTTS